MRDDGGGALSAITVSAMSAITVSAMCVWNALGQDLSLPPAGYTDQLAPNGSTRPPIHTGFTPRWIGCANPVGFSPLCVSEGALPLRSCAPRPPPGRRSGRRSHVPQR